MARLPGVLGGSRARVRRSISSNCCASSSTSPSALNAAALSEARIGDSSSLLGEGEGRPMIASTTSGGGCRGGARSRFVNLGMLLAHVMLPGSRHGARRAADAFLVFSCDGLLHSLML